MSSSAELLINLAFAATKPTGHTVYAENLLPSLKRLDPILLRATPHPDLRHHPIPANLTPEQGSRGHLSRLLWTQFQLPSLYRQLHSKLLFSPVPEAPLLAGCRSVVTLHDLIPLRFFSRFSRLALYFRHYVPQVLAQAEQILCNSEATARDAVDFWRIPAQKLTVTPLAYDATKFQFLDLPRRNYFLFLGRHEPYKNLQRVIQAFAHLPQASETELWIAGPRDPRYTPDWIKQVAELNLTDRVKFLDYVPYAELPTLINQAIALVFPSLWEGFGLPVLEAMACGTPVITSNLSALPEVAGEAALLVDPYKVQEITDAMAQLLSDPTLFTQLRHRGLAQVEQFSWEKTAAQTTEVLAQYL